MLPLCPLMLFKCTRKFLGRWRDCDTGNLLLGKGANVKCTSFKLVLFKYLQEAFILKEWTVKSYFITGLSTYDFWVWFCCLLRGFLVSFVLLFYCHANPRQLMAFSSALQLGQKRALAALCSPTFSPFPPLNQTTKCLQFVPATWRGFMCCVALIWFCWCLWNMRDFNSSWLLIFRKSSGLLISRSLLITSFWCTTSTESFPLSTWNAVLMFHNRSVA